MDSRTRRLNSMSFVSNREGLDNAIGIIEKNIEMMETKLLRNQSEKALKSKSKKVEPERCQNCSAKEKSPREEITANDSHRKKKKRRPTVSVLLKRPTSRNQPRTKSSQTEKKSNKETFNPEKKSKKKQTFDPEKKSNKETLGEMPPIKKSTNRQRVSVPNIVNCEYARPTLCHALKVEQKRKKIQKPKYQLPFMTEATQSKSHNIGVVIQQAIGNLNAQPSSYWKNKENNGKAVKRIMKDDKINQEDIRKALVNVNNEIKSIKK